LAKHWPALDVRGVEADLVLAAIDDYSPTAIEQRDTALRIFFATADARDGAIATLCSATLLGSRVHVTWERVDVSDEDWAQRSQQNLPPVTVGRITIVANPQSSLINQPAQSAICNLQSAIRLVIPPSMAFGTGHHATTRLCLAALQTIDLAGTTAIDVGTGSGVLALAAAALGAARAFGIDNDADAVAAARENLTRNPHVTGVEFRQNDLRRLGSAGADVVTANLTATLIRSAAASLLAQVRPGGHLIVSGILAEEFGDVIRGLADGVDKAWMAEEDGWIGARLVKK
jgi:ribosomal protein L11 methyltransferase